MKVDTTYTIEEKNRVFAEFMDMYPVDETNPSGFWTNKMKCHDFNVVMDLKFDKSFDWLMEVVEKVESIKLPNPSIINVSVEIKSNSCRIFLGEWNESKEGFISCVSYPNNKEQYTKKEATFNALFEFIMWYNEWHKK